MSSCSFGDLSLITNSSSSLQQCLIQASNGAILPPGPGALECMSLIGVSVECSSCWQTFFNETYTCIVDQCNSDLSPTRSSPYYEQCTTCAEIVADEYDVSESVCGFRGTDNEVGQLIAETLQWLDNVAKTVDNNSGDVSSRIRLFSSPTVGLVGFSIVLFFL